MENVIVMSTYLVDNMALDLVKTAVRSYVSTMKQLVQNTFSELFKEPWRSSAEVTSHDMLVLVTAFCSLFGLLVSLAAIYTVCKVVLWICVDRPTSGCSEY